VKIDKVIHVSGTTAANQEGNLVGIDDAQKQTTQTLLNIKRALESVSGALEDVVRTRIYVTDISKWEEIGNIHEKFFKDIRPATSMIEVKRLVDARMLVEIEAEAILK